MIAPRKQEHDRTYEQGEAVAYTFLACLDAAATFGADDGYEAEADDEREKKLDAVVWHRGSRLRSCWVYGW